MSERTKDILVIGTYCVLCAAVAFSFVKRANAASKASEAQARYWDSLESEPPNYVLPRRAEEPKEAIAL